MSRLIILAILALAAAWLGGAQEKPAIDPPGPVQPTPPETPPATAKPAENPKPAEVTAEAPKAADAPKVPRSDADPAAIAAPSTSPSATAPSTPAVADAKMFVIGPEDVLNVRVWREPELSGTFAVRPDGKISLNLVGEIQAAGMTPEQFGNNIAQGLSRYMNHPEVSVSVSAVNSRKYYIQGEVGKAGSYPLVVPTTVLEALVNAGGFREFANTKKILILRKGGQRFRFNYKDVTKGKRTEQNILLEPGDQIIVN